MSQRQQLMALPLNQLQALYDELVPIIKMKRQVAAREVSWTLRPGLKVSFKNSREGRLTVGTVESIKTTKAVVKCLETGVRWNVTMSALTVVPSSDKPAATDGLTF